MRLRKLDIARRQIEVAAELFFAERDFIAVITLVGAAEEILGKLIQRKGEIAMLEHLTKLEELAGGHSSEMKIQEINGICKTLKHTNDASKDEIEVEESDAFAMLSRAVASYVVLNGQETPIMVRVYEHLKGKGKGRLRGGSRI
jgi:hypothetical protein